MQDETFYLANMPRPLVRCHT